MDVPSGEPEISFIDEGVDWILLPTRDISLDLEFYEAVFGLTSEKRGYAKNDPFLEEYAILKSPNGVVIELVRPKKEFIEIFKHPVFCYTVENLLAKADLLRSQNEEIVGGIVDTGGGWGWLYA